ncbi:hypothetical protein TNCV_1847961 [Trichonephila clavipes]|nr:hypothetical protein TNCV_1847961 [Trichonephila clavipes]
MPPRRNKEKVQQLTQFERRRIIGLLEGGFSYHAIGARCAAEQFQSDVSLEVAKTVRVFYSAQHMQLLPWSAYSPDMSLIEHLRDLVGRRFARDPRPAATKDKLLLRIQAIWNSLPQADIQNLFDSMPRRIAVLIAARDGYKKSVNVLDKIKQLIYGSATAGCSRKRQTDGVHRTHLVAPLLVMTDGLCAWQ